MLKNICWPNDLSEQLSFCPELTASIKIAAQMIWMILLI